MPHLDDLLAEPEQDSIITLLMAQMDQDIDTGALLDSLKQVREEMPGPSTSLVAEVTDGSKWMVTTLGFYIYLPVIIISLGLLWALVVWGPFDLFIGICGTLAVLLLFILMYTIFVNWTLPGIERRVSSIGEIAKIDAQDNGKVLPGVMRNALLEYLHTANK